MRWPSILVSLSLWFASTCLVEGGEFLYHHMAPDQHKLSPGWQEPGLWRPKWIMFRSFPGDAEKGEEPREDRVYFKLKPDRTMKVYTQQSRPSLEVFKPKVEREKKKRLFEVPGEAEGDSDGAEELQQKAREEEAKLAAEQVEGTWWWQDASPANGGNVKIETREGADKQERVRHDGYCEWGTLDGYSAKFKVGKIIKYKMTEAGVPLGTYQAGTFTIRASAHRPLVGKDFLAFE